jgi:CDP-diacylglycerol--glycerol-3-phosphate 3-phosphatidyltransferase
MAVIRTDNQLALNGLRKRWMAFWLVCMLSLAGGFAFLSAAWQPEYALRWLFLASLTLTYLLAVLWRGLPYNYRAGENFLLPTLGWGNRLTLLRGALVGGLVGFLFSPQPSGWLAWLPGILYTLADAADFFDGYLARRTCHATHLGEILDMSFDGLGVLAAAALAVQYRQVPAWYLLVALARYLFLAGAWLRQRLGLPVYTLPPSATSRILAGLQMGFVAVMLWPLFTPPGTHIAAALFGLPFLLGFLRDWLYTSGVLRSEQAYSQGWQTAVQLWLPFALRLGILALGIPMLYQSFQVYPGFGAAFLFLIFIEGLVVMMLVLGITSRINAILALCLLGFHQLFASLTPIQILLAIAYAAILFMGSGALSLWVPEDYLFYHHAGEQPATSQPMESNPGL